MSNLQISVPAPLERRIDDFKNRRGYANTSEAARELLRRGLNTGGDRE